MIVRMTSDSMVVINEQLYIYNVLYIWCGTYIIVIL